MLIIKNDKLEYCEYAEADVKIIPDEDFLHFLSENVKFADDLTFERLFNLIITHKDTLNVIYKKCMGGHKIDNYINEFNETPTEEKDFYLTIDTVTDLYDKDDFNIYHTFSGFSEKEDISYSIALTSLKNLKKLNIKLINKFEISKFTDKKYETIFVSNNLDIKLFDAIDAILREITFYGTLEDKNVVLDELETTANEIKNDSFDKEGLRLQELKDSLKDE